MGEANGSSLGSGLPAVVSPDTVKLICPVCAEQNELRPGQAFLCGKCGATLAVRDAYWQLSGKLLGVLVILSGGVFGGGSWIASSLIDDNRYPVLVEHAILEKCIGPTRTLTQERLLQKRAICGCALERVQADFDDDARKENGDKFLSALGKYSTECGIR